MEYYKRIQKAVDFIDRNLTDTVSIKDVAKEALLSEPHLYKIFPTMTGCTVGQYIRKRRLSRSVEELKNTKNEL